MKQISLLLLLLWAIVPGCEGTDPLGGVPSPASVPDDGPEFPNDLPAVHDINGLWEDSPREARINQTGNDVTALFVKPFVCDHSDGTGETSQTDLDFNGTIEGDTITGETSVCRHGFSDGSNGITTAAITLTISPDDLELSGTWHDDNLDADISVTLTRLGCLDKTADDFGLPPGNGVNSEYNANRVYRKDGSVQTVPDDYVLDPATDKEVRQHRGVDYSSMDADGNITEVEFSAGVSGTAGIVPNSAWNTINVTLPNGNVVQYLHASTIHVTNGQAVTPGTVLGQTGNTGVAAIHLHVQAKNSNGDYINPSCAE